MYLMHATKPIHHAYLCMLPSLFWWIKFVTFHFSLQLRTIQYHSLGHILFPLGNIYIDVPAYSDTLGTWVKVSL